MDPDIAAAIAQISQGPKGEVRVRLHDKHAALVAKAVNRKRKNSINLPESQIRHDSHLAFMTVVGGRHPPY
jgi:hypothetical protein